MDVPNNDSARDVRPQILERSAGGFFKLPNDKNKAESNSSANVSTAPSGVEKTFATLPNNLAKHNLNKIRKAEGFASISDIKTTTKTNISKTMPKNDFGLSDISLTLPSPSFKKTNPLNKLTHKASPSPIIPKRTLSIGKQNSTESVQQKPLQMPTAAPISSVAHLKDLAKHINPSSNKYKDPVATTSSRPLVSKPLNASKNLEASSLELDSLLNPLQGLPANNPQASSPNSVPASNIGTTPVSNAMPDVLKPKLYGHSPSINPELRRKIIKKQNNMFSASAASTASPAPSSNFTQPTKHSIDTISSVKNLDNLLKSAENAGSRSHQLKESDSFSNDRFNHPLQHSATNKSLNPNSSRVSDKTPSASRDNLPPHTTTSKHSNNNPGKSYHTYAGPNNNPSFDSGAGDVGFDSLLNELAQLSGKTFTEKGLSSNIKAHSSTVAPNQTHAPPSKIPPTKSTVPRKTSLVDGGPHNDPLDAISKIAKKKHTPPPESISNRKLSDYHKSHSVTSELTRSESQPRSVSEYKSQQQSEQDDASNRELFETNLKRKEADSIKMDKKEADRRELEMIAAARMREQGSEITGNPALIIDSHSLNKAASLISNDYVNALCTLLEESDGFDPLPEDFYSTEGFSAWESTISMSIAAAVSKIIRIRFPQGRKFIDRFSPAPMLASRQLPSSTVINQLLTSEPLSVCVSIFEARNLILKDPKKSAVYCEVQSGGVSENNKKLLKNKTSAREVYRTTVCESAGGSDSSNIAGFPKWNQRISLETSSCDDIIQISVLDKKKDVFYGQLCISFMDILLTASSGKQVMKGWFPLKGSNKKDKQKYVGGDIYFEAKITSIPAGILPPSSGDTLNDQTTSKSLVSPGANQSLDEMMNDFESIDVKFNSLFFAIIKICMELDFRIPGGKKFNQLLSPEARAILKIMSDLFNTSIMFIDYSYLKLVYDYCSKNELQVISLLSAYERLKEDMKTNLSSISSEESELVSNLLRSIYDFYKAQIINYKEVYPDNKPPRVLETIILIMRMIYKNPLYSRAFTEYSTNASKPQSFRDELRAMLSEAALRRYQKLKELTDPLDDSDIPSVVNSVIKLTELIYSELKADKEVYHSAFIKELDIARLTSEIYLKYYILALEHMESVLPSDNAISTCSEAIFELHSMVQQIDNDYAKKIPGLKRQSVNMGFCPERWFTAFVLKWLNYSENKLIEWATNAVSQDKFTPVVSNSKAANSDFLQHSSSIVDLFSGIYAELKYINDLNWPHTIQNVIFIQSFAKSVYRALETYFANLVKSCVSQEEEEESGIIPSWQSFINMASQRKDSTYTGPKGDIKELDKSMCVRLCNIEYAIERLKKLYSDMKGSDATSIIRDYRNKQQVVHRLTSSNQNNTGIENGEESQISGGTFTIVIVSGENLRGINKNGTSNPYVILSLPYGTKKGSKEESSQSIFTRYLGSIGNWEKNAEDNNSSNQNSIKGPVAAGIRRSTSNGETNISDNSSAIENSESPSSSASSSKKGYELIRTRPNNDTINPTWDETFSVSIPKLGKLNMQIMSKNFISSDTLIGTAIIDLSKSTPLHRLVLDNHTHNIYLEVEPQGRVHLRITMEGASEDTDFWFKKARECAEHLKNDIVQFIASHISLHIQEMIVTKIKEQEAATVSSKYFFSLKTTVKQLETTQDGKKVTDPMTVEEITLIIDPIFDYLNKNLTTLTDNLTIKLSQEIIRRIWDDIEQCIINVMVPQLYGTMGERRVLNTRQLSLAESLLNELCSFFHAEGEEMGLPMRMLKNMNYDQLLALFAIYPKSLEEIKAECESELSHGFTNSLTLRCARNKIESIEGEERNAERKWFEAQLLSRKTVEQSKR